MNKALGFPLTELHLGRAFELAWPSLETQIIRIEDDTEFGALAGKQTRSQEEMLEELIVGMRDQSKSIKVLEQKTNRTTVIQAVLASTDAALSQLGEFYGIDRPTPSAVAKKADQFDSDDWSIIETAPFLLWYLTQYKNISRPPKHGERSANGYDDVEF